MEAVGPRLRGQRRGDKVTSGRDEQGRNGECVQGQGQGAREPGSQGAGRGTAG